MVSTLALLAGAAGALVYARYGVDERGERERKQKEREERLFSFEADGVRELTVTARGSTTHLARAGGGWRIPELSAEAEKASAEAIAEHVAGLKHKREAAPAGADARTLASFGLVPPRLRVEAVLADGRKEVLEVGEKSGFDGSVFARAGQGSVWAVPGDVDWWLDKSTFDLRSKVVLQFERSEVAAIRVEAGGKPLVSLEKRPAAPGASPGASDEWTVTAPPPPPSAPVSPSKISGLLYGLSSLRATRFVDETGAGAARAGLERPSRIVILSAAGGKELARLELGKAEGDRVPARASGSPRIVEVAAADLSVIPGGPADVVEKPAPAPDQKAEKK